MPTVDLASVRPHSNKKLWFWFRTNFENTGIKKRGCARRQPQSRDGISNEVAAEAADAIAERFFRTWSPGRSKVIAVFWPIKSEINIRPLIEKLYQAGCRYCSSRSRGSK